MDLLHVARAFVVYRPKTKESICSLETVQQRMWPCSGKRRPGQCKRQNQETRCGSLACVRVCARVDVERLYGCTPSLDF